MSTKINNINIKAFRGIPCREIPLDGKSLLLIGENGTGKSSLVDAIEFFFTGNVSSLQGEGTQGITLKRHVPHKDHNIDDVKVELTFSGDEKLTRTFNSTPLPTPSLNDYFNITQNGTFILRRKKLLNFIDVAPAARFKAITDLIGIEHLNKIESQMRQAMNNLNKEMENNIRFLETIIQDISTIVGQEISTTDDVLPVLNTLLEKNGLPQIKSFEDISEHKEKMYRFTKSSNKVDMFRILQEILDKTQNTSIKKDLCIQFDDLNNKIKQLLKENLREILSLKNLLETSKAFLKKEEKIEICPLCEQNIEKESLLEKLEKRYKNLEEIITEFSEIKKESSQITAEIRRIIRELETITSKIELFKELEKEKDSLLIKISSLDMLQKELEISNDMDVEIASIDLTKELLEIKDILKTIVEKSNKLESEIELNEEEEKFLEFVEMISKATTRIEDIKKAQEALNSSKYHLKIAETIYDKFSTLKSDKIKNIFNSIESDIQKYYSFIHQDEPHKNIKLKIKGKGTGALLEIESFGKTGENPKAYTSEGHLDTLGLCIFLAFVKKFNQDCSLIILDDIVTTVDSAHREKICRLLFENFKKKQFILTTHDGLWYKQVIALLSPYGLDNNFMKCVIYRWDESTGPSIKPYQLRWERIQDKIKSGDKSCAGNEGRQYLEWVLENICKATKAELPLNDIGYTVSDLMRPARRNLKSLIKDEKTKKEILDAFKEIDKTIMGNLLSHHNKLAANVSIEEVKGFCKSVNNLHKLVSCPSCKRFLTYQENAGQMMCSKKCSDPKIIETN